MQNVSSTNRFQISKLKEKQTNEKRDCRAVISVNKRRKHVKYFVLGMKHLFQRSYLADSFSRATEMIIGQSPQPIIGGYSGKDSKENPRHNELRLTQRSSNAIQVEVSIDSDLDQFSDNYSPKVELILLKYYNWKYSTIFIEPWASDCISIIDYRSKKKIILIFFFCFQLDLMTVKIRSQ